MPVQLEHLNPQQREAVCAEDDALLILAGAGSGKTRVLTERIAYLIEKRGVPRESILAFTFTNKAAQEMKERVEKALQISDFSMWIGTFHSLCGRILRKQIHHLGYDPNYSIYDAAAQQALIKQILKEKENDSQTHPRAVLHSISVWKNELRMPEDLQQAFDNPQEKLYARVYLQYEKEKKKNNAIDFDDMILLTLQLFRRYPDVLRSYQQRFEYLFIDEYQDTNRMQYELIRALCGKSQKICAVGDADQSIYGWRGADIRNILDFEKDFAPVHTIVLEQNYRSTKTILDAANRVIQNNTERKEKVLWTENEKGQPIQFHACPTDRDEAQQVVRWLEQAHYQGVRYSDCAVLYRINAQSRAIEEALIQEGIPYRIVGGLKFYDRAEIKDLSAYMMLCVNPLDDLSFLRVVNTPRRGIGAKTLEKLAAFAQENGMGLLDACKEDLESIVGTAAAAKLSTFANMIEELQEQTEGLLSEFFDALCDQSGYERALNPRNPQEQARLENIESFRQSVIYFERENPEATLSEYLQNLTLMSDLDKTEEGRAGVSLMTVHAAKGLEFPHVAVIGLSEGVFPAGLSMQDGDHGIEEERRLFYVAATRAQKQLYLSYPQKRYAYGSERLEKASRFLSELGDFITMDDAAPEQPTGYRPEGYASRKGMNHQIAYQERLRRLQDKKKELANRAREEMVWKTGDYVRHKRFGKGMIVQIAGEHSDELVIAFDGKMKRFNASLAVLERCEE